MNEKRNMREGQNGDSSTEEVFETPVWLQREVPAVVESAVWDATKRCWKLQIRHSRDGETHPLISIEL